MEFIFFDIVIVVLDIMEVWCGVIYNEEFIRVFFLFFKVLLVNG